MTTRLHSTGLMALHFVQREDGMLVAPSGSVVTFRPIDCVVSFVRCWSAVAPRFFLNFFCAGG